MEMLITLNITGCIIERVLPWLQGREENFAPSYFALRSLTSTPTICLLPTPFGKLP